MGRDLRDPSLCLLQEGAACSQATNSYPALPPKEPKLAESAIPMFSTKCHKTSCQGWNFSLDPINLCVHANNHICVTSRAHAGSFCQFFSECVGYIPHGKSLILQGKSLETPQKELLDPRVPHVGAMAGNPATQEMLLHPSGREDRQDECGCFGNQLL